MIAYWDTSAFLPLLLQEPRTAAALVAARLVTMNFGWDWMRVEAEAGLRRRRAPAEAFKLMEGYFKKFQWVSVVSADHAGVCTLNERHRLRAADAGHFYCFSRLARALPEIQLIGFDDEMTSAARSERLNVWAPP
jgi:hypothetical protein